MTQQNISTPDTSSISQRSALGRKFVQDFHLADMVNWQRIEEQKNIKLSNGITLN